MTIVESIKDILKELVKQTDQFVIFPYGIAGYTTRIVLRDYFDIEPIAIIDNDKADIYDNVVAEDFFDSYDGNYTVLLATHNCNIEKKLIENLESRCIKYINMLPIEVGRHSFGPLIHEYNGWMIEKVGAYCSFAEGVRVVANHDMTGVSTCALFNGIDLEKNPNYLPIIKEVEIDNLLNHEKTAIGNDVWLGQNVIICNGAKIGDGVIAGAGTVIIRDVPDYAVVVGVPGRVIKYRYTPKQIETMKRIKWWNWEEKEIAEKFKDFRDIKTFIERNGESYDR